MTIPERSHYNQWGGLKQAQASWSDRMTRYRSLLQALTDMLSTLVSAIHALYLQLKWMREDLFVCILFTFWHDMQTWQFQFRQPQTTLAQYLDTQMLLGQDVTCLFSLLYPCPGDKSVSFLSFWWVADCTMVVQTCPTQTMCWKRIAIFLAVDRNRQILSVGLVQMRTLTLHYPQMSLKVDCAKIYIYY